MATTRETRAVTNLPVTHRARHALLIDIFQKSGSAALSSEPVSFGDLVDGMTECWMVNALRKGRPDLALDALEFNVRPVFKKDARPWCAGYAIDARFPGSASKLCTFARESLAHVATRAAQRLLVTGELEANSTFTYDLRAEAVEVADVAVATDVDGAEAPPESSNALAVTGAGPVAIVSNTPLRWTTPRTPLAYARHPLQPLLERARHVGLAADSDDPAAADPHHAVFYTREARDKAESCARKGGDRTPPVETGAVLVGTLCSCPDTGEMFCVVFDAIEATDAQGTTFSLTFSSQTWARVSAIMKARRANPATRSAMIVGQAHGHNFLPANGAPPCEACATIAVCSRHTAFMSGDDVQFARTIFSGQPWSLHHVFGLNARGEPVATFQGQHGGVYVPRGYHVLDEFDPSTLQHP